MRNILFFDSMITPKIITVLYWVMIAFTAIAGVVAIVSALFSGYLPAFLIAVFSTVAGLVFTRIWCELLIVLFKINGNLQKMADATDKQNL